MRAYSREEAFTMANCIMKHDYLHNAALSMRAGYPIYSNDFGEWISDLGTRLEVNTDNGRKTTNIFIYERTLEADGFTFDTVRGVWLMKGGR